jgi:hypothetical protein
MRLQDLREHDHQLDEILPAIGAAVGGAVRGVAGAVSQGVKAVGQTASGLAGGGMDPAQAAAAAKDRQDQKKQVQDAIKQKQQELADLQKQLVQIG